MAGSDAPGPSPPLSSLDEPFWKALGSLKYAATEFFTSLLCPTIQRTMNSAIMAVTKSA